MNFISNNIYSNYICVFYCSHDSTYDHGAVELRDNRSLALKLKYLLKIIKYQLKKDHFILFASI